MLKPPEWRDDMIIFKDWLAGKICPVCKQPLDNGTALMVAPGFLVRHLECSRPAEAWRNG